MKLEIMQEYKSNVLLLQRLALAFYVIQLLVSSYHLFVPSIIAKTSFSPVAAIAIGVIVNVLGLIMSSRFIDLESLGLQKFYRLVCFVGLTHQYYSEVNTIYPITVFVIAVIGEQLIYPNIELIKRTQNYASHEKLTDEVFDAVSHANSFLNDQVRWISRSLFLVIIVAVVGIFTITLINILPLLIGNVRVFQYIAIVALIMLLVIIVRFGFPQYDQTEDEFEVYN